MNIEIGDISLYYETVGNGAPLVMVHGNGENHTIFDKAAEELGKHYTCYLPDSRGHGQSSPVNFFDYEDMAEDMAGFIRKLGIAPVIFYGFSDGGIIGLILASKYPDLVSHLIVSGANTHPRGVKDSVYYLMKTMNFVKPDPKVQLMLTEPHISGKMMRGITAKTLVLAGSKDLIKESDTKMISALVPDSTLQILPGEGHGSYIVHSEKIAQIILEFMKTSE